MSPPPALVSAPPPLQSATALVREAVEGFLRDIVETAPDVLAGLAFLVVAGLLVKAIMTVVKYALKRTVAGDSPVYRQFVATVVGVFLWFGVGLSFLSIVGLERIAASLGTAAGFVALGVSYALSNVIADAVAGVYLLRDPDFNPGDTVDVGGTVGEVASIELRKTRLRVDGDTVVRGNAEIEKKWTKMNDAAPADAPTDPGGAAGAEASGAEMNDTGTSDAGTGSSGAGDASAGD